MQTCSSQAAASRQRHLLPSPAGRSCRCKARSGDTEGIKKAVAGIRQLVTPVVEAVISSTDEPRASTSRSNGSEDDWRSPTYALIAANAGVFVLSNCLQVLPASMVALSFKAAVWVQFITSGFLHSNLAHLTETAFLAYTFGRLLERRWGAWGVWGTYLSSVIGANLLASWLLPAKAVASAAPAGTLASSAGVLGLFLAGLALPRTTRKPLEVLCLAPFVVSSTVAKYAPLATVLVMEGTKVGHLVHVAGAAIAASCAWGVLVAIEIVRERVEAARRERERAEAEEKRKQQGTNVDTVVAEAISMAGRAASQFKKLL